MTRTYTRPAPTHPGELLAEDIADAGVTQAELARALEVPRSRISAIIRGERPITADTALRLARFFGTSPEYWLNLQARYDLDVIEQAGQATAHAGESPPRPYDSSDRAPTRNRDPFDELVGNVEIDDRNVIDDHDRAKMWMNAIAWFIKTGDRDTADKLMRALGSLIEFRRVPTGAVDPRDLENFPRWNGEKGTVVVFLGGQVVATADDQYLLRQPT